MRDWKQWIKAAGIRAIKTMAQAAIGVTTGAAFITGVNWWVVLSASLMAGVTSLLMSIAGLPELEEPRQEGGDDGI